MIEQMLPMLPTQFAPAERSSPEEVRLQREPLLQRPLIKRLMDIVPSFLAILNGDRQVLVANMAFANFLGCPSDESMVGFRTGEAIGCSHAVNSTGGCGTTEHCEMCGAARALMASQRGMAEVRECSILRKNVDALDLKIWATPFELEGVSYTFFVAEDRSGENRRRALERIFFHDVLNTMGGLYGYADLLNEQIPENSELRVFSDRIFQISSEVIDEIKTQKDLSAAENLELKPTYESADAVALSEEVARTYRAHQVAEGRQLRVASQSTSIPFVTDKTLVRRVVGNLVKNALEASTPGQTVTIRCADAGEQVLFTVHNPGAMSRAAQLQVFNRSFSTKGRGRGLGSYSVKLLTEKYLGGQAFFTSNSEQGTTFSVRIPKRPV